MNDTYQQPEPAQRQTFRLTLRDVGESEMPQAAIRLRHALKFLLRVCRFRALQVEDVTEKGKLADAKSTDRMPDKGPIGSA